MLIPYTDILTKYNFIPSGILHLGAHEAEEAEDYQKSGVQNVIWVEGNPELIPNLKLKMGNFPGNKVLNLLVSDTNGDEVKLNITNSTMSSSILDLAEHKVQHPGVDVVKTLSLSTTRLDSFIVNNPEFRFESLDFLNIDIQGAELLALRGLGDSIKNFKFIYTEINLANIYEGCPLLQDLDLYLGNKGFKRVETAVTEWLWGDALYMKADMSQEDIQKQVEDARTLAKKSVEENKAKKITEKSNQMSANKTHQTTLRKIAKQIPYLKKLVNFLRAENNEPTPIIKDAADISTNGENFFIENLFLQYQKGKTDTLVLFDVGANMGLYTEMLINFCRENKFDYKIHLFEPQPFCFEHLKVKFKDNTNCTINNFALSDSENDTILYTDTEGSPMASMFDRENLNLKHKQTIKTKTLQNYIIEHDIKKIDLLKIDVEGNELAVIKGAAEKVETADFIQFEYGGTYLDSNTKLEDVFGALQQKFEIAKILDNEIKFVSYSADLEDYKYSNFIGVNKLLR